MKHPTLVYFTYGAIGDAAMLLSLTDAVQAQYPGVRQVILYTRGERVIRELAKPYEGLEFYNLKKLSSFFPVAQLMATENNVIVPPAFGKAPLHFKLLARLLSLAAKSRSLGFRDRGMSFSSITLIYNDTSELYYDNMVRALAMLGFKLPHSVPTLRIEEVPLSVHKPYVVIHPFASNPLRGLPTARFTRLVHALSERFSKEHILITGGKGDAEEAAKIAEAGATSVAGMYSLTETANLVKDAVLFVGVDTGITHIASMLGVPSIVLGNRSNPSWLPRYNPKAEILFEAKNCSCQGNKRGECRVEENGKTYLRCTYDIADAAIDAAIEKRLRG